MNNNLLSKTYQDFKTLSPDFTGERYTVGAGVRIAYEHFNRYCFAFSNINENDVVLDLACGTGYGSIQLAQKAKLVYALDVDQTSLDLLNVVCKKHNINNIRTIKCNINDIEKCPELENVTAVVCHELIEHINEDSQKELLRKISTATAPFLSGCKLFVSTPEKHAYNNVNVSHNEFHLHELSKTEFTELVLTYFKHAKFFWQLPISGDLISPFEVETKTKQAVNFVNWTDSYNLVGFPASNPCQSIKGTYMYAICSAQELNSSFNSSLVVDPENKELLERFVIAAEELKSLTNIISESGINKESAKIKQDSFAFEKPEPGVEQKLLNASAKKIKDLIFEAEKAAAQKVLLEKEVLELESQLSKVKPLLANTNSEVIAMFAENPEVLPEALAYYQLRNRFAHRLGNYILFTIQRKKPVILLNRFYKYIKLVLES